MSPEQWLPVVGYEGLYAISSLGHVRSESRLTPHGHRRGGHLLKPNPNGHGYLCVALCRDGKRRTRAIHILMAVAFLGPRPRGKYVHHKDGNRTGNAIGNLAYLTPAEHNRHHFTQNPCGACALKGEKHTQAKLTDAEVAEIRKLVSNGMSRRKAAGLFGVNPSHVSLIVNGKIRNTENL